MRFKVQAADIAFAAAARGRFEHVITTRLDPQRAFEAIVAPEQLGRWLPDLKKAAWEGAPPHGVGSHRTVVLKSIGVQEHVLLHEPGVRFAFTIARASLPILNRMVEDFRLEPVAGGTRVHWTIAWEPRWFARPLVPVLAPRFGAMFAKAAANLEALPG